MTHPATPPLWRPLWLCSLQQPHPLPITAPFLAPFLPSISAPALSTMYPIPQLRSRNM